MVRPDSRNFESVQPYKKEIKDIGQYFERREILYRQIGFPPRYFEGKSIIEFGPGHGENALFVLQQRPNRYALVDSNPACIKDAELLLNNSSPNGTMLEFYLSDVKSFECSDVFDVVICEGVLAMQAQPVALLDKIATYVRVGGILDITWTCSTAFFAEILRRLIGTLVSSHDLDVEVRADMITPYLTSHLSTLKGMARAHRNWVLDNMVQPWTGKMLSIRECVEALTNFSVYGMSPRFMVDLRWYRESCLDNAAWATDQWFANQFNLMDYRVTLPPNPIEVGQRVSKLCDQVYESVKNFDRDPTRERLRAIANLIAAACDEVAPYSSQTAESINDFLIALRRYCRDGDIAVFKDLGSFCYFFGRGMQYLTLIRNS